VSHTLLQRVVAGMGANSVGMAVTIGTQLASLPLFLAVWDTRTYGVWLMISALPAYLAMADVGMVTAAGNHMTMAMGAGQTALANRVFQSAQGFVLCVCGALALLVLPGIWWSAWPADASTDQRLALMALVAGVLVSFLGGLSEQLFKATHRYAQGTLLGNATRLAEWAGWMLGLLLSGSFAAVALGGLLCRVAGTLLAMHVARHGAHGLRWGLAHAAPAELRRMVRPAAAFMAFPLANALSLQGVTLLVGTLLGPVAVAVLNTYRTLARTAVQATAILSHALWPEFARLFGQGALAPLRRLAWRSAGWGAAQSLLLSAVLFALAPWLLRAWTHGEIGFDPLVFGLLMAYAAVAGLCHVPRVLLMSINRHGPLALWTLLAAALCVALAWLLSGPMGLTGAAAAMLTSEALLTGICLRLAGCAVAAPAAAPREQGVTP
jgi:O-antigen/teichoic acid export membrane protein